MTNDPRSVIIDGVHYYQRTAFEAEAMKALHDAYGILWTEAYYDPDSEATQKFALRVVGLMKKANETLRFKT